MVVHPILLIFLFDILLIYRHETFFQNGLPKKNKVEGR